MRLAIKELEAMDLFDNIVKSCNISVETIIKNYEKYLVNLNGFLFDIPQDKEIKKLVGYFDFSITNYVYVYNNLCTGLRSGKYCFGSKKYSQDVNFSFLLMLKLLVHDLITLRNLSIIGFDAQFHSMSRNFVEKMKNFSFMLFISLLAFPSFRAAVLRTISLNSFIVSSVGVICSSNFTNKPMSFYYPMEPCPLYRQ